MPSYNGEIVNRQAIINVIITPADNTRKQTSWKALIDTGATVCGISAAVINSLSLHPKTQKPVVGIAGSRATNIYRINLHIPITTNTLVGPNQLAQQSSLLSQHNIEASEISAQPGFDVLLGMNTLEHCVFFISGNRFTIAY